MMSPQVMTAVMSVAGLLGVLAWRVREGRTAMTTKKIVMPPLGMATGFCMFLLPAFRVPLDWAVAAVAIGATVLAYPLLKTTSLRREGDAILMKRSSAFFAVVVGLAAVRYFARGYFDHLLTVKQTGGLFYLLAFGMIVRWRVTLLLAYRRLTREVAMTEDGALQSGPMATAMGEAAVGD